MRLGKQGNSYRLIMIVSTIQIALLNVHFYPQYNSLLTFIFVNSFDICSSITCFFSWTESIFFHQHSAYTHSHVDGDV